MDTIDKRLLRFPFWHFADKFCDRTVCQQHELFNQLIGIFRLLDIGADRLSGFIDLKPYFKAVEVDGPILETFLAQLLCQRIQFQYLVFIIAFPCFNHQLCFFVSETAVALNHRTHDTRFLHIGIFVQFKDGGET